jgi:hypothetical protein
MATLYRFLSEDDTSDFCHKVSAALAKGWQLHGAARPWPSTRSRGVMRCGQAVTKDHRQAIMTPT